MHCLDKSIHTSLRVLRELTFYNLSIWFTFENEHYLPGAVTIKAHVAHFVSDVDLRIWTVQTPTTSRVDLAL